MADISEKFSEFSSTIKDLGKSRFFEKLVEKKSVLMMTSGILVASYVSAIIVSSLVVSVLLKGMAANSVQAGRQGFSNVKPPEGPNYVTVRLAIMDRNLFSSEGEFPDESALFEKEERKESQVFDPHAKCSKSSLKIKLLGTIYIGNSNNSLATIMEEGYQEADIYRVGDQIIGQDNATVVAVERKKIVINNAGNKECIEVEEKKIVRDDDSFMDDPPMPPAEVPQTPEDGGTDTVTLQGSFVEQELGDGYAKIISAARMVPNMEDNQVVGFKIFAIKDGSLLSKVGLKNGDVITKVNETSLKDPAQGFALYEAMQNEREINIHVLRGGKTPKTLRVNIK